MFAKFKTAALSSATLLTTLAVFVAADEPTQAPATATQEKAKAPTKGGGPAGGGFPDLVKGLKETPGCLGVETARTSSGKSVIFAWFKDKQAAIAWYKSPMHCGVMGAMDGQGALSKNPLKNVKDDDRPVLAIASITFSEKPELEGVKMPISQIAIEIYQPVDGGISIGGSFAPEGMIVPETKTETPKK